MDTLAVGPCWKNSATRELRAQLRLEAPVDLTHTARTSLTVNGRKHVLTLDTRVTLLDALRDHLGLTGTKKAAIKARAELVRCSWMAGASIRA